MAPVGDQVTARQSHWPLQRAGQNTWSATAALPPPPLPPLKLAAALQNAAHDAHGRCGGLRLLPGGPVHLWPFVQPVSVNARDLGTGGGDGGGGLGWVGVGWGDGGVKRGKRGWVGHERCYLPGCQRHTCAGAGAAGAAAASQLLAPSAAGLAATQPPPAGGGVEWGLELSPHLPPPPQTTRRRRCRAALGWMRCWAARPRAQTRACRRCCRSASAARQQVAGWAVLGGGRLGALLGGGEEGKGEGLRLLPPPLAHRLRPGSGGGGARLPPTQPPIRS